MGVSKMPKGCFNCMKRRIMCDRKEPECGKCLKKGLVCPGRGIRYRFNDGVAARGKLKGHKYEVGQSQRSGELRPLNNLTWVDDSIDNSREVANTEDEEWFVVRSDAMSTRGLEHEALSEELPGDQPSYTICPSLDLVDCKTRYLFTHFSNHVSPVMIRIDGSSNGYRHHILPLAHADATVRRAVCVASAFHLSVRDPTLRIAAEAGRATIIRKMREEAIVGRVLGLETWATIILLFVAELIIGSDDILTLYRMLMSFVHAGGEVRQEGALAVFLDQQTRLIEFFTRPAISEDDGVDVLGRASEPTLSTMERVPDVPGSRSFTSLLYSETYSQASAIYLLRAQSDYFAFPSGLASRLVVQLKDLVADLDPDSAGAHTLVWPYFVAAAESTHIEHRSFFVQRLEYIWERTGYRNVLVALQALEGIWEKKGRERWTAMLPAIAMVIM